MPPPPTVARVDLERYQGTWYEIARLPVSFENNCYGVTATYTLRGDGTLRVVNACHKGALDGPEKRVTGQAWVVDQGTNARLKVQFFWPFSGDYWVFMLDPEYNWAVVGSPDRQRLWVLSRTPQMGNTLLEGIISRMEDEGFAVTRMIRTPQPDALILFPTG
jgi:apolipoprotein D and lipocalin family protein